MTEANILRLNAHGYAVAVDAAHGASLTSLKWRKPDGEWFEVLHPCPPGEVARSGGSFVMTPFANRLDGGRFETDDGVVQVPLNRPEQKMAVHGFSRDRAWRVVEAADDTLVLVDDFADDGIPFRYRLTQAISIGPDGVEMSLSLTSTAERTLPYGMGFHPWFRKESETWLTFKAETGFGRDERGFPTVPMPVSHGPDFSAGLEVSKMPWFDGHFSGWALRRAVIEWRRQGVMLEISGDSALRNLHVYVPDTLPVFCVEPVSHVPDVHNRRDLAAYGDVEWLGPGKTLAGRMRLRLMKGQGL